MTSLGLSLYVPSISGTELEAEPSFEVLGPIADVDHGVSVNLGEHSLHVVSSEQQQRQGMS